MEINESMVDINMTIGELIEKMGNETTRKELVDIFKPFKKVIDKVGDAVKDFVDDATDIEPLKTIKRLGKFVVEKIPEMIQQIQDDMEWCKDKFHEAQDKLQQVQEDARQKIQDAKDVVVETKQKVEDTVNKVTSWWDKAIQWINDNPQIFYPCLIATVILLLVIGILIKKKCDKKKPMSIADLEGHFDEIYKVLNKIDTQAGANAESVQTVYDDVANNSSQYDILFKGYEKINVKLEKMSKILEKIDNNKNGYDVLENKMVDGEDEYFCGN